MSNKQTTNYLALILIAVLALGVIAASWYLVASINTRIDEALAPVQQVNGQLATQVADLLHPTPTVIPDPVTIIQQVQAIARLETIRYNIEKVISAEINHGILDPLLGDKLLFVAHGYVIAGIDMSKIQASDLALRGNVLEVHLPEAEVLETVLDNEKSYVYYRDTGILARPDQNLETQARQVAEQEILNGALDDGILDLAAANAQTYLRWFFETLGYQQINFVSTAP